MNAFRLVIFDLDGTLVDAYTAIIRSFNFTMKKLGYPVRADSAIRRAVGWGDRALLAPFVEPQDLDRTLAVYRRHHARSLLRHSRLFPSAKDLLMRLKQKGLSLAVASNRPTRFSRLLIRHLKIDRYFDYVLCGDRVTEGKPHPEILRRIMARLRVRPDQTLYVGDMTIDAQAGRRARVKTVIVTTGSSPARQISRQRPWKVIKKLSGLRRIV